MVEGPDTNKSEEVIHQKNEAPKKKFREEKQPTKVVIRRLPGTMTEESFLEHTSPLFEHDYLYYVQGKPGDLNLSRAYINFVNHEDVYTFTQKFDDYVFIDGTGQEFPAVVEFSPFQRIPKNRTNRKNDPLCGTIDEDPDYQEFVQQLEVEEQEHKPANQLTEHYFDLANDENEEKVTTTPLIEFLTSKKNDWLKHKEEKKEERRKRDLERRKLKEESRRVKKELKEAHKTAMEKIAKLKDDRKKEGESKLAEDSKVSSVRIKGKSYQEERQRDLARRKQEDKPLGSGDMKDSKGIDDTDQCSASVDPAEKEIDGAKEESKSDRGDKNDNSHKKVDERKNYRDDDRRYSYSRDREEKKFFSSQKKRDHPPGYEYDKYKNSSKRDGHYYEDYKTRGHSSYQKSSYSNKNGSSSSGSKSKDYDEKLSRRYEKKKSTDIKETRKSYQSEREQHVFSEGRNVDKKSSTEPKIKKDEKKDNFGQEAGSQDKVSSACLDGEPKLRDSKGDHKKDDRAERRIKNKDRPALEIYRPGMGKFSRQRIERNKSTDSKDED